MTDFKNLRPIALSDKPFIERLISLNPSEGCEANFANLFMWADSYKTQILSLGENSAIAYSGASKILHFPLGERPAPGLLAQIAEKFAGENLCPDGGVYDVPPDYAETFAGELGEKFEISERPEDFDYIYENQRLLSMEGKKLRKKRGLVKRFESDNPNFSCDNICSKNKADALSFMERMNSAKLESPIFNGIGAESGALARAFENFEALGLCGLILRAEAGEIAGAAVFSRINGSICTVHFEKSDASIKGAPQMLVLREAQAMINIGASFMNREQDLGLENLRRAKESLEPLRMYRRRRLRLKLK